MTPSTLAHLLTAACPQFISVSVCVCARMYLQFDVNTYVLTRAWMVEQMEDSGDQSFVDATQLTVNHTLQNGAEASPFGHHLWVLQGYRRRISCHRDVIQVPFEPCSIVYRSVSFQQVVQNFVNLDFRLYIFPYNKPDILSINITTSNDSSCKALLMN